jgi:hypothetical protein
MKLCTKCKTEKDEADFNRNSSASDGLQHRCKPCQIAANREWAQRNPETRRAAAARRYQRELLKFGGRRPSKQSDPTKHRAHVAVELAIKQGRLTRPLICEDCGADGRAIQAHHDDYSRPIEVRWLCAPCHGAYHAQERAA